MKCRTCEVEIPGPNGESFYGSIGVEGVQCEPCAVAEYKEKNPFWNTPFLKIPVGVVDTECAS